jgi:cobyrinic acid a,c-diamide synthase
MKAFIIAGVSSGTGKTSISIGITKALTDNGLKVQTFKVGPDYLDPTWLKAASKNECYNLDVFMTSEEYVKELFYEKTKNVDVALIEGVMGLYDGADSRSIYGSTAHISKLLSLPVILVVDAGGLSNSIAAIVKGYQNLENIWIVGIIANFCGSEYHAKLLQETLNFYGLPSLIGYLKKNQLPKLPQRHLGIYAYHLNEENQEILNQLGSSIRESIDINHLLSLPEIETKQNTKKISLNLLPKKHILIAYDDAFYFYYPDNLYYLKELGFKVLEFSPLKDQTITKQIDMLYIGGGYPELYAETLEKNHLTKESIYKFYQQNGYIYAECGGLMYLSKFLEAEDQKYAMVGIFNFSTRMLKNRKVLGYRIIKLKEDCFIGNKEMELKGHEFHYSEIVRQEESYNTIYQVYNRKRDFIHLEGYQNHHVIASYIHLHFYSNSECFKNFITQTMEVQK